MTFTPRRHDSLYHLWAWSREAGDPQQRGLTSLHLTGPFGTVQMQVDQGDAINIKWVVGGSTRGGVYAFITADERVEIGGCDFYSLMLRERSGVRHIVLGSAE